MRVVRRSLSTAAGGYLSRRSANHAPLTPLNFLSRSAAVFPDRVAIAYDDWSSRLGDDSEPQYTQTRRSVLGVGGRVGSAMGAP